MLLKEAENFDNDILLIFKETKEQTKEQNLDIIYFLSQPIGLHYVLEYPMYLMYRMYLYVTAFHAHSNQPVRTEIDISNVTEKMTKCKLFKM